MIRITALGKGGHSAMPKGTVNAIWLLTKGGPLDSTEIMYTYAYRQAFVDHKFGYAAATSVVIFIVIAILTVIYVKMIASDRKE